MGQLRHFFMRHRALAFLLVMAALCMKAVVPTGFMIGHAFQVLSVQICHEGLGDGVTKQIVVPMKGGASDTNGKQGKGECPFSVLSMASMTGADPALLAVAMAFILMLGFVPIFPARLDRVAHLRPPLRGPPALT